MKKYSKPSIEYRNLFPIDIISTSGNLFFDEENPIGYGDVKPWK